MINHTANDNAFIERLNKEKQFQEDAYEANYNREDDEASSSFASSSMDASVSYDNGHGHGAVGLINPSDMIMEQSNDDDDSYVDQRPRRCVDLLGD